jgi:putative phosphotransacetylase
MKKIPVGISGRHLHVTQEHLEILFGKDYQLTVMKDLSQPGQYASNEKVDVVSPKGKLLPGVRILGPVRKASQVEISRSDAIRFKFIAPRCYTGRWRYSWSHIKARFVQSCKKITERNNRKNVF